jgi:glutamyl-tRNA synthetase
LQKALQELLKGQTMSPEIQGPVRVRFAPSPTGFLHVGGARTAIYNDLARQHYGGAFILRIEDTDRQRSDEAMTRQIQSALAWIGTAWDEGPFLQSERLPHHRERGEELVALGRAYRCFCTPAELEAQRAAAQQRGEAFRYPRTCLALTPDEVAERVAAGQPFVVRFRMPDSHIRFTDLVRGEMDFPPEALDDYILLRSDGSPTYHMSVVCDDIDMRVTHVIRGEDHLSNTPKHIPLFEALGGTVPVFGHLPLILGTDRKRLSKRFGATSVEEFRAEGFLPQALYNYLALLGWSPGEDREIMSREEMARLFSVDRLNASPAVFDREKLTWMNAQYVSALPLAEVLRHLAPMLDEVGLGELAPIAEAAGRPAGDGATGGSGEARGDGEVRGDGQARADEGARGDREPRGHGGLRGDGAPGGSQEAAGDVGVRLVAAVELHRSRARTLKELAALIVPHFRAALDYDPAAIAKFAREPDLPAHLRVLSDRWAALPAWTKESVESELRAVAQERGLKAGALIHPTRTALSGVQAGPPLFDLVEVMGRDATLRRLDQFAALLARAKQPAPPAPAVQA